MPAFAPCEWSACCPALLLEVQDEAFPASANPGHRPRRKAGAGCTAGARCLSDWSPGTSGCNETRSGTETDASFSSRQLQSGYEDHQAALHPVTPTCSSIFRFLLREAIRDGRAICDIQASSKCQQRMKRAIALDSSLLGPSVAPNASQARGVMQKKPSQRWLHVDSFSDSEKRCRCSCTWAQDGFAGPMLISSGTAVSRVRACRADCGQKALNCRCCAVLWTRALSQ